jgi:hypothetical protein
MGKQTAPAVGDTVWTRNMMLMVEATNPKTGEEGFIKLNRRAHVKIVALPDDNSGENNYTCETPAGMHFYMTRDEFETADE